MSMKLTMSAVGVLAVAAGAWADGFRNPPEGAAALGKAGVSSVFVEDASALSHNSARLAGIEQPQLQVSLTLATSATDYESPIFGTAETKSSLAVLPNVYYATPLGEEGWVGAIGLTTPYGQSTEWKDNGAFHYTAPYFAEMALVDIAPTFARTFERLSVGVGLDLYAANLTLRQRLPVVAALTLPPGAPLPPDPVLDLEGDATALGGHLGLSYQACDYATLGLSWRSGFSLDFEGDTKIKDWPGPLPPTLAARSDFETSTDLPNIVAAGCGLKLSETLRVEFQVEWTEHSAYQDLTLDLGKNTALLPQATIPQDWDDTWIYSVGADWTYAEGRVLRAGYARIPSPIPDRTFSPNIPDADRHVLALGWGRQACGGWLDLAYAYSALEDRDISNNQNPAFNGSYEIEPHLLAVSYRRDF